jgi:hypothetical protein
MMYLYLSLGSTPFYMADGMVHYLSLGSVAVLSGVIAIPDDTDPEVSCEIDSSVAITDPQNANLSKTGTISSSVEIVAA